MYSPATDDFDREVQEALGGLESARQSLRAKDGLSAEPDIDEEIELMLREHTQREAASQQSGTMDAEPQPPRRPSPERRASPPQPAGLLQSKCSVIFELAEEEEEEREAVCTDSRSLSRLSRAEAGDHAAQELLQSAAGRIGETEARLLLRGDKFVRFDRLAHCLQTALDRGFCRSQDIVLQLLDFEPLADLLLLALTDGAKTLHCSLSRSALLSKDTARQETPPDADFAFAYRLLEAGAQFFFPTGQPLVRGALLHIRGMAVVSTGASCSGCLLASNIIAVFS